MRSVIGGAIALVAIAIAMAIGFQLAPRPAGAPAPAAAAPAAAVSIAAVPGQKGTQDPTGPYDVVLNWPKPMSQLPGHDKWTWGAAQGVFAESPNRVFLLQRGELPVLERPKETPFPSVGPSISYPVGQAPWRNASVGVNASPGNQGADGWAGWQGKLGVDARWEHNLVVVDADGNITEQWTQWDDKFRRPHSVTINPYDAEKHIWVVEDRNHVVMEFSHDGKQLIRTFGVPGVSGTDGQHFNRPTFLAWLPDGTMFVSDGYANTRVMKFDKDGKFVMQWGEKGNPPNDTRPGTFDAVHGVQVDPDTRRVYVTDRSSHRIQTFDENGKFISQFSTGNPSQPQVMFLSADKHIWVADHGTERVVKYDLEGNYLYSWGSFGEWPGGLWNVHGMSVDQEGNLYLASVNTGRTEKFKPRAGANPAYLVGQPVRSAWK